MRSGWTTYAAITFTCSRKDGRTMMVHVAAVPDMLDQWQLLALEGHTGATFQGVLDDHAHLDHGKVFGLAKAMAAAEAFARKWQRQRVAVDPCTCAEMAPIAAEKTPP